MEEATYSWRYGILAGLLVSASLWAGCQFKGGSAASGDARQPWLLLDQPWQVRPVRMRIYPSTRFVRETDQALLEARVEFLDENGDSTKAVGEFRLELFSTARASGAEVGRRLFSWVVRMFSRQTNEIFYDPITRAYLFRLKIESLAVIRDQVLLRVTFLPAAGERMEAEAVISPQGGVIEQEKIPQP
ncbi:MAG: hypothetical protein IT443_01730 [Phycisphaeraceae bacterium]|nr:hypothetical protein [Phycisphaeraceae bacterium]